jgi:predicted 3-demethylubiquinone-9 3-methyltransferase (glyoxalase superfamily)
MQKITPFLWFDGQAEEAADFYVSLFKNSKVTHVSRFTETVSEASGQPVDRVMTVSFDLEGQKFMALNGGPMFKFSEALSFMVGVETQQELDYFWDNLVAGGGEPSACGWLKDKFGLSWQIVPDTVEKFLSGPDPAACERAMGALMQMTKIDIAMLERAYHGDV